MKAGTLVVLVQAYFVCGLAQSRIGGLSASEAYAASLREQGGRQALKLPLLDTNIHPFRKVGERYWDLRAYTTVARTNLPAMLSTNWTVFQLPEVIQVLPDGLLLDTGKRIVFLKNYPGATKFSDKETIPQKILACEVGTYRYRAVDGSLRTVKSFDYGEPFAPWQRMKEQRAGQQGGNK